MDVIFGSCFQILRNGGYFLHGFTSRRWPVGFSTARWQRFWQSFGDFEGITRCSFLIHRVVRMTGVQCNCVFS